MQTRRKYESGWGKQKLDKGDLLLALNNRILKESGSKVWLTLSVGLTTVAWPLPNMERTAVKQR